MRENRNLDWGMGREEREAGISVAWDVFWRRGGIMIIFPIRSFEFNFPGRGRKKAQKRCFRDLFLRRGEEGEGGREGESRKGLYD